MVPCYIFDFPKRKKGQIGLLQKTNIKVFYQEKHKKNDDDGGFKIR